MSDILITYKERFRRARYNLRRYTALLLVLAMLTTLFVNWQLHGVGISMTADYQCGETEHIHTDECYALYLTCGYEEGELMNAAEIEAAEAQQAVEQQNSAESALSDDAPLQPATEWVPHTHTEDCYTAVQTLTCLEEEHTHGDDCFDPEDGSLLCDKFEHTHTDACYTTTYELACGLADGELVEQAPAAPALLAAQDPLPAENSLPDLPAVEPVYHHHTEDCYQKTLVCPLEEHRHTVACLRDPMEDIETEDDWLAATNIQLTGQWNTDLLAVAETQLGYKQSEKNFEIDESDGVSLRYYSRYGQFYNNPYGEWDVMFLAYCLKYAGVDRSVIPQRASVLSMRCDMSGMAWLLEADDTLQPQPGDIVIYQKYLTRTVAAESQADGAEEDLDDGFWADDFSPDTTPDAAPDTETGAATPDTAPLPEDAAAKPVVDADETNTAVPGDTDGTLLSALPLLPQEPAAAPDTAVMGVTPDTAEPQPGYTIGAFAPSAPTEDELAEEAPLTRTVTDGIPVDTVGIVREVDADLGTLTVISGDVHGEVATVELTLSDLQGMIDVKAAQNSIAVALSPTRPSRAPAAAAATATGNLTMGVATGKSHTKLTYDPTCQNGDYLATNTGSNAQNGKGIHYQLVLNVPTSAAFDGTGGLRTITVTLPSGLEYQTDQTVAYLGINNSRCETSVDGVTYDLTTNGSNFTATLNSSTNTLTFEFNNLSSLQTLLAENAPSKLTHLIVRFTANVSDSYWTNYPGGTKTYTCSASMTEGGNTTTAGEATSSITLNGNGTAKVSGNNVSLEYWMTNTTQEEQHGFYGPGKNEGAEWAYGTYKTQQIGYQLIVDLNAYETLPETMTFTAQLPKGVTYRTNTASVVFAHSRSNYGEGNTPKYTVTKTNGDEWKLAHYFRSESDNDGGGIVADALQIDGQTLTFTLKGFDQIDFVKLKNDTDGNNYKDLVLRFRVDFADEDSWDNLAQNKFTYATTVTSNIGENAPITKTTSMSLKRDPITVQKSAQQIPGTNRIRYAVVINPSASELNGGNNLKLTDVLTLNGTNVQWSSQGSVYLYEYKPGVDYLDDSPAANKITTGYSALAPQPDQNLTYTFTPTVPDNTACVLVYEYTATGGDVGKTFTLSNTVTLKGQSSTTDKTYTYNDTQNNLVFNATWLGKDGNSTTPAQNTINVEVYADGTQLGTCTLTATGKWQGYYTLPATYQTGQTLTLKTTFTNSEDYNVTYTPTDITPGTPITITIKPAELAYELPSTGGCGTLPFTAVGGTLMLAALAYGIYLKRHREGRADR